VLRQNLVGVIEIDESDRRPDFGANAERDQLRRVFAERVVCRESRGAKVWFVLWWFGYPAAYVDEVSVNRNRRSGVGVKDGGNEWRKSDRAFD